MSNIIKRARGAIQALEPYNSARSIINKDDASTIYLDANEYPYSPCLHLDQVNRYAGQQPDEILIPLVKLYNVSKRNIVATRGADEAIDILMRSFCEAGQDNIIISSPTFVMYKQSALIQGAEIVDVPLDNDFSLNINGIIKAANAHTKIIFVCSPNNPTGTLVPKADIELLCKAFDGKALIVADETYIEYAEDEKNKELSLIPYIEEYPNLVILRTISKAYGAAGLRCGCAISQFEIINIMRKVLAPYPIPVPAINAVNDILKDENIEAIKTKRKKILDQKAICIEKLRSNSDVTEVYKGYGNFILAQVKDAKTFMQKFATQNIILRDQSAQIGLKNAIRITIGTDEEMESFYEVLIDGTRTVTKSNRVAKVIRKTKETSISVMVDLDNDGFVHIDTGIGFYDHMLDQIARHAGFSMQLQCEGDLHIDPHHTIEDCAIALGQALKKALGNKSGIERYGFAVPMDEAAAHVLLDLGGRFHFKFDADFPADHAGDLPTDMIEHIFHSLAENMQANLHIRAEGDNTHHIVEACFKGFARALKQAVHVSGTALPSTKGLLA